MATNEQEQPPVPTASERYIHTVTRVVSNVTDTGTQTGISLRVWAMLAIVGAIASLAVFPLNVVGTVTVIALALTLAARTRPGR